MARVTSIGKFRNDQMTILDVRSGLSADNITPIATADGAIYENGTITVDIAALSQGNASGKDKYLRVSGFKARMRIVDASLLSAVKTGGNIEVWKNSTSFKMLKFASGVSTASNTLAKPGVFNLNNNIVDRGDELLILGGKKAFKGTLVLTTQPY